jgi:drug/metabolite transporter, DME family
VTSSNARLYALAAAALFSTGGTAIKYCSFSGLQVASLRCAVAALAIVLLFPETRRGWTWRVLPVAGAYALQSLLFATSNKLTTAANAIFLQSTSPLYVLLLSPLLLREKIRGRDVAFLAVLAAGLVLFFVGAEPASRTATDPVLGNMLAAGSGVGWALTVMGIRWLGRSEGDGGANAALRATLLGNVLACVVSLSWALPLPTGTARDWGVVVFLGVVQIALAYRCLTLAAGGLAAMQLALLLVLEPVLSAVWAWIFHDERPGPWSAAGAATILGATIGNAIAARSRPSPRDADVP